MGSDFGRAAADAVMDLTGDDDQELRKQRALMKWDRKKKKFVGQVIWIGGRLMTGIPLIFFILFLGGHQDTKDSDRIRCLDSSYV